MPDTTHKPVLAEALQFDPWWRHGDPVPPWVLQILDKAILQELAVINAQMTKSILEVQLKAADATLQVLTKAPRQGGH